MPSSEAQEIILLSFFDGTACAALACHALGITIRAMLSWEIDDQCIKVISHHFPATHHMGDALGIDVQRTMTLIEEVDPERECRVIITAGPPCPDFSRVRKRSAPGHNGTEGSKFIDWIKQVTPILDGLGRRAVAVVENVLLNEQEDIYSVNDELGVKPFLIDAALWGLISRPRLWWIRPSPYWPPTDPRWKDIKFADKGAFYEVGATPTDPQGCKVSSGDMGPELTGLPVQCLTTPAPTSQGRAAPFGSLRNTSKKAFDRWTADGWTYAPWQ